jgi:hypothetical protein
LPTLTPSLPAIEIATASIFSELHLAIDWQLGLIPSFFSFPSDLHTFTAMESSPQSYYKTPTHYPFGFASPPELLRPIDRFSSPARSTSRGLSAEPLPPMKLRPEDKMSIAAATNPNPTLLSPPESPETPHLNIVRKPSHARTIDDCLMTDQPLLPEEGASISLDTPLFSVNERSEPLIGKAISTRTDASNSRSKPTAEEYNLFVSSAWRLMQSNPREWLRQEKHHNNVYRRAQYGVQKLPYKSASSTKRPLPVSRPKIASGSRTTGQPRPARAPRATPKARVFDDFHQYPTPESDGTPKPPKIAAASREDSDFNSLPDMTPPTDTLPNSRCLTIDWKGTHLPIEHEPYFELLHPAEAKLASILRLTPAIYLSSKRRIFIEKIERTRIGKEFRKTDSQKACKIDVNKASKLWTVFDKVGWFDRKYIDPHL